MKQRNITLAIISTSKRTKVKKRANLLYKNVMKDENLYQIIPGNIKVDMICLQILPSVINKRLRTPMKIKIKLKSAMRRSPYKRRSRMSKQFKLRRKISNRTTIIMNITICKIFSRIKFRMKRLQTSFRIITRGKNSKNNNIIIMIKKIINNTDLQIKQMLKIITETI